MPSVLPPLLSCYSLTDVPAQIAVISDRLSSALGHNSDENEAAALNSRIQVNVCDPSVEPCHQSVSTILLRCKMAQWVGAHLHTTPGCYLCKAALSAANRKYISPVVCFVVPCKDCAYVFTSWKWLDVWWRDPEIGSIRPSLWWARFSSPDLPRYLLYVGIIPGLWWA